VCTHAGYALETRCHLGKSVVFDTVERLGWSVDVRHHVIKEVVTKVLGADVWRDDEDSDEGLWHGGIPREDSKGGVGDKNKRNVPKAIIEDGCVDCFKWEFGDFLEDKEPMA